MSEGVVFFLIGFMIVILPLLAKGMAALGDDKAKQDLKAKQDAQIVCPQCQTRGYVTTQKVSLKKGVSGGKATGAVLTGGLSLLATGLSRKEDATKATCSNCGSVWHF